MKVTFLGTNGWYDTSTGNTPSVFVDSRDSYTIFDAGFGFYKAKDFIVANKPVRLFLSHLHLDHLIGLHTLPLFKIKQGVDIYSGANMIKQLRLFLKRPFTSPPIMLKTKIRFHAIGPKEKRSLDLDILPLRHSVPCLGYRLRLDGRIISYCTDTGLCSNLKRLAKKADLLITECAMSPGDTSPNLFHLTPQTAARVAVETRVGKLALFHFDPGKYPDLADRSKAASAAKRIFKDTVVATDGATIEL